MPSPQEYQAQDEAFSKQYAEQQAQKAQEEAQAKQPPTFLQQWMAPVGKMTLKGLDSVVSAADAIYDTPGMRKARDVTAGVITGAANMADSAVKFGQAAYAAGTESSGDRLKRELTGEPAPPIPTSPIWDHAKQHIMDFRDAVSVQDPSMLDSITQGTAQVMLPWAGYSRALAGIHGIANFVTAGALTDATVSGAHDPRMADVFALGKQTEGKFGEVLRTLAPDGSALNAYINWLHDRTNEGEAEGRFKNVIDGLGTNLIVSPVLTAIGSVLKQGQAGLRYLIDNGVGSGSELASLGKQRGGPAAARVDPADEIATEQARKDMASAAANPSGKRPPLRQGEDPAQPIFEQEARRHVEAHAAAEKASKTENNASGESSASLEAINRHASEQEAGVSRWRIDPDGNRIPLVGVDAVDAAAPKGSIHVIRDAEGNEVITDRGGLTQAHAKGLLARSKLHGEGK